ncbi:MAG: glutamate-5-semialdehyde dehydrogenase [Dehalococcoidia bacterium]
MSDEISKELKEKVQVARDAASVLAHASTEEKNLTILAIADLLIESKQDILSSNATDYSNGLKSGMSAANLDRLLLNDERIESMAEDARSVALLPDPVGEEFDSKQMENGLEISKRRVPLGVIATIYESRPNVTVDISTLAIKSGNSAVLRGGKEAINSNIAISNVIKRALKNSSLPDGCIDLIESTDRKIVSEMLAFRGGIDLLIPRGGAELIRFVAENASVPVVTGGVGVCHIYVDSKVDIENAVGILDNAKVQRPTVCNALDTILIHSEKAPEILSAIEKMWGETGNVEVHADERAFGMLTGDTKLVVKPATSDDWGREFLSLTVAIKVVDSIDEAMVHIAQHGDHSEAILTHNKENAERFLNEVDSAAVYVNASTRFTDGGQFGLGAEVAISTNKLHARGPMGLQELTSYKWIILGDWDVRS